MIESIVLGAVQGIVEWLPVSSEGVLVLTQVHLFGETSLVSAIDIALFLHIGTLLAALVYFRKDVRELLSTLIHFEEKSYGLQRVFVFLLSSSVISGVIGFFLLRGIRSFDHIFELTGKGISIVIGLALLVTALLLYTQKIHKEKKYEDDLSWIDSLLLGVGQGLAVIPGLSRSGTTVSLLLLREFGEELSLKLSFLMSIPIVTAGALLLIFEGFAVTLDSLLALLSSFIFGLLTINVLMRLARKINFAHFVLFFALLTLLSVFI